MVDLIHKAIVRKNVLRQEKFRIVCYRPETLVDDRILMAVSHDEQGKLLAGLAVILQKSHQFITYLLAHLGHTSLACLTHNHRHTNLLALIFQHKRGKVLLFHDADSHEAIEPSVGGFFCNLFDAARLDVTIKRHPTMIKIHRHDFTHQHSTAFHSLWHLGRLAGLEVKAQSLQAIFHPLHQYSASFGSEAF